MILEGGISLDGIEVEDVHSDSRRVGNGSLFVAIPGGQENGEKYLRRLLISASVVVTENEVLQLNGDVTKVYVSNARMAPTPVARRHNGCPDLVEFGGSNGYERKNGDYTDSISLGGICVLLAHRYSQISFGCREIQVLVLQSLLIYFPCSRAYGAGCSEALMEVGSHSIHQCRVYGLKLNITVFLN